MSALWLLPLAVLLWRFQGGAWFAAKLPGRPVWYVIPILALAAWLVTDDGHAALVTVIGLLAVTFVPHGRWYTLNNKPRELAGPPSPWEEWIEYFGDRPDRDDAYCLFAAKAIAFAPLGWIALFMGWPWAFVAAGAAPLIVVAGYAIGRELYHRDLTAAPTGFGEYAAGLAIALIIMGMGA